MGDTINRLLTASIEETEEMIEDLGMVQDNIELSMIQRTEGLLGHII